VGFWKKNGGSRSCLFHLADVIEIVSPHAINPPHVEARVVSGDRKRDWLQ
jgi:hypothetical protein